MRISLELVPRGAAELDADLAAALPFRGRLDTVNIPDLLRFPQRSWEACALARRHFPRAVPHVRSMDFPLEGPIPFLPALEAAGIGEVLVVRGDPPQDMSRRVHATTPPELIAKLKREAPGLKVYAAADPYRQGYRDELEYARRKRDAGCDGFFTQPFFDPRWMEVWMEALEGETVFWGLSPVLGEKSRSYWEARNRAAFPKSFAPTWEWNIACGRRLLELARSAGQSAYLMPIKADVGKYLAGVLGATGT